MSNWTRRGFLAAGGVASIMPRRASASTAVEDDIAAAYVAGFPLVEMARLAAFARAPLNTVGRRRTLSSHVDRSVTMPNNDTLYASIWLDLSRGPVDVDVPLDTERYVSLSLMTAFTDVFAIVGNGGQFSAARRLRIVGSRWNGDEVTSRTIVRMPSEDGWAILRTSVRDDADLPLANTVQDRFVAFASGTAIKPPPPKVEDPATFIDTVNTRLSRIDPRYPPTRTLSRFQAIGIGPGRVGAWSTLSGSIRSQWREVIGAGMTGRADMASHARVIDGWSYPNSNIAGFGCDASFRAAVALSGMGALPESEAMYLTAVHDAEGRPFHHGDTYRLSLPDVPVDAFWSLSAYSAEADGRFFFADNLIGRNSIGSNTLGLQRSPDGRLPLLIGPNQPSYGIANWLPLVDGPFRLVFRAYRPQRTLLTRSWKLPALQKVTR